VENKADVARHIFWPQPAEYRLFGGLRVLVGARRQDRTALYTVGEVFVDKIYRIGAKLRESPVVVDLGANIGIYSLYAAHTYRNASVYSVEPDEINFAQLQANIAANGLEGKVHAIRAAVAPEDGELTFYLHPTSSAAHSLVKKSPDFVKITALTLNSVFENFRIDRCDILKMDIEGAEYEVLFQCNPDLLKRVDHLFVEYHDGLDAVKDPRHSAEGLKEFFIAQGFRIVHDHQFVILASRATI
jgi:FkbM family methyltransferase